MFPNHKKLEGNQMFSSGMTLQIVTAEKREQQELCLNGVITKKTSRLLSSENAMICQVVSHREQFRAHP